MNSPKARASCEEATECLVCGKPEEGSTVNFRRNGKDGFAHIDCLPLELALSLADTAFVYRQLCHRASSLGDAERMEFAKRGRLIVAMAKYAGIATPLSWVDAPLAEVEAALARMQEHGERPEGWPYGEYWLLG